ncbi:MAG: thioredoxin fold domain-containing protein [Phycisphaeraceae bacterium]|nr:thioredoxin fold domain-containing protein [Phycisphaeraceae bacterium]
MNTPNEARQSPDSQPMASKRKPVVGLLVMVVVFVLVGIMLARGGSVAQTPEFMPTLTDLSSVNLTGGQPVVVVVTADWCPPCQTLKRTTLADDAVRALLSERTQAVMLDATDSGKANDALGQLDIRVLPTTVVIREGRPVARLEGYAKPDAYLAWLQGKL